MEMLQKRIDYLELQIVRRDKRIDQLLEKIRRQTVKQGKADLRQQVKDLKKANWALTIALDKARQPQEVVEMAYVEAMYFALKYSGQLLKDVSWSDLDKDFRTAIHTEARRLAEKAVK